MDDLQSYWDKSSSTIPTDKDPSNYAIEKEKNFPKSAVICDLGCGSGADSLFFAAKGHSVKLIDISEVALERARTAAEKQKLSSLIETFQCNLSDGRLPLVSSSCDVVYSRLALHYFRSDILTQLFSEIYRLLTPAGNAYITIKSPDDAQEMAFLRSTSDEEQEGVFLEGDYVKTRFTQDQLKTMLNAAGLADKTFQIKKYVEYFTGKKDKVKSGNAELVLTEILITKP
jgi:ubiquinone/menaquinone biosynthesis C-methylase UbiE